MTTAGLCLSITFFFISGVGSIKEEKSFFRLQNLPLKRLRTVDDKRIY